ncbi:hypothetical protein LTR95_007212, partial [Oleoguttula sp. CCFEE 5521]
MADPSDWAAYEAVQQAKEKASNVRTHPDDQEDEVPEKDPVDQMGVESRRVVKKLIQVSRDRYADSFDVIAAEKYQRRHKVKDPDKPFRGYAVIQRLVVDHQGKMAETRLEIRSRKLCAVIKELGANLGGQVNLDTIPIVFKRPFQALFFLYRPLEHYLTISHPAGALREEIELLVAFIRSPVGLKTAIRAYKEQVELHKVSYGLLWSLYPPGTVVYSNDGVLESCSVVESTQYVEDQLGGGALVINLVQGHHNGEHYGLVRETEVINAFPGIIAITPENLTVVPFDTI